VSEDADWIAEYAGRSATARGELKRAVLAYVAEERRRREAEAAKRRRAEEQDRREWTDGIRRRLGLVAEVHHCRVWQISEHWWAWACQRPGCYDADWQHTANSERTRAAAWAKASAHSRRFKPSPPQLAPGAGLDLTGFQRACEP
jgi:hypothetical protein